MDISIKMVLNNGDTMQVRPNNIVCVLEANQDAIHVTLADCSAVELLRFILTVQKDAIAKYIASSTER